MKRPWASRSSSFAQVILPTCRDRNTRTGHICHLGHAVILFRRKSQLPSYHSCRSYTCVHRYCNVNARIACPQCVSISQSESESRPMTTAKPGVCHLTGRQCPPGRSCGWLGSLGRRTLRIYVFVFLRCSGCAADGFLRGIGGNSDAEARNKGPSRPCLAQCLFFG